MTEPRMRLRQKGQQFPTQDCKFPYPDPSAPSMRTIHPKPPNPITTTTIQPPKLTPLPLSTVEAFLLAFGDNDYPLPETMRVLDEIITDYIIETCHEAASVAHHARRAKIKLDDFKFMLRRDTGKLGRVSEMLETDKELKRKRKAFDTDEGAVLVEKDGAGGDGEGGGGGGGGGGKLGRPRKKVEGGEGEGGGEEPKKKKKKKKVDGGGDDASTVRSG